MEMRPVWYHNPRGVEGSAHEHPRPAEIGDPQRWKCLQVALEIWKEYKAKKGNGEKVVGGDGGNARKIRWGREGRVCVSFHTCVFLLFCSYSWRFLRDGIRGITIQNSRIIVSCTCIGWIAQFTTVSSVANPKIAFSYNNPSASELSVGFEPLSFRLAQNW